MTGFSVLLW